jgi:hypothetical protein
LKRLGLVTQGLKQIPDGIPHNMIVIDNGNHAVSLIPRSDLI